MIPTALVRPAIGFRCVSGMVRSAQNSKKTICMKRKRITSLCELPRRLTAMHIVPFLDIEARVRLLTASWTMYDELGQLLGALVHGEAANAMTYLTWAAYQHRTGKVDIVFHDAINARFEDMHKWREEQAFTMVTVERTSNRPEIGDIHHVLGESITPVVTIPDVVFFPRHNFNFTNVNVAVSITDDLRFRTNWVYFIRPDTHMRALGALTFLYFAYVFKDMQLSLEWAQKHMLGMRPVYKHVLCGAHGSPRAVPCLGFDTACSPNGNSGVRHKEDGTAVCCPRRSNKYW